MLDWRALERVLGAEEKAFQAAYWKYRDAYDRGALSAAAYWETVAAISRRRLMRMFCVS
jgi:hypothetical protein